MASFGGFSQVSRKLEIGFKYAYGTPSYLIVSGVISKQFMHAKDERITASGSLLAAVGEKRFSTILADPPWRFQNKSGKMAPEHHRLSRYPTLSLSEIEKLPVEGIAADTAHLYLWIPNALLAEGLAVMSSWGFEYKTNIVWYKVRKDGGPDRRGVGFYFRNVTEMILFGVRGKGVRTLQPGRSRENVIVSRKREHSRKPDEQYGIIETCSRGPFIELFARGLRKGWFCWGNQVDAYSPDWLKFVNGSQSDVNPLRQSAGL